MRDPIFLVLWFTIAGFAGLAVFLFCMWSRSAERKIFSSGVKNKIRFFGDLTLPFVLFHIPMQILIFRAVKLKGMDLLHSLALVMFCSFVLSVLVSIAFEMTRKRFSKTRSAAARV